jgi:uncharacterized protein YndB with AHSA1/START domain
MRLRVEKVLAARSERVFAAFVDRKKLAEWWGPAGFTCPYVSLDLRQGGAYRIAMQPPQGEAFHLRGEFREIDPPRRLAYTFEWEPPDPDDQPTVVTVSFLEDGQGTKVVVDQGPFKTEARRALHQGGWTESLDRLEKALS